MILAELGLGAALAATSPLLAAAMVCLTGTVVVCVLAPRPALFVLAAGWAPIHLVFSDVPFGTVMGAQLNLSRALGLAVLAGFGAYLLADSGSRVLRPPLPAPLVAQLAFVLLFALAALLAPSLSDGAFDLIRLASGVVIMVAAFRLVDTADRLDTLTRLVTIAGVVLAVGTLVEFAVYHVDRGLAESLFGGSFYVQGYDEPGGSAVRVGVLGSASSTAGALLAAEAFALLRFGALSERRRARAQGVAVLLIAAAILATLTRAAIGGLLILVALWALQRQYRSLSPVSLRTRLAVITTLLVGLAIPLAGASTLQGRLWDINPFTAGSSFAQGRGEVWAQRVDTLRSSNPLELAVGHGAHTSYAALAGDANGIEFSPHNLVLWLLIETGVVGLVLYAISLLSFVPIYLRATRSARFRPAGQVAALALAALATFLALNMFQLAVNVPAYGWYFMLLFGATLRSAVEPGAAG